METTEERKCFCPHTGQPVMIVETWMIESGCGCAVSAELLYRTCSAEVGCPHASCSSCLLRHTVTVQYFDA